MVKKKSILFLGILIVVAIFLINFRTKDEVVIGDVNVKVDIADTKAERNKGLSGRSSLNMGEGMLFVFEVPGLYGFWMKDMSFAIDVIWIGEDKRVVGIEKNVEPSTFPKVFYPPSEVLYVLEVPATFSDTISLKLGQSLLMGR